MIKSIKSIFSKSRLIILIWTAIKVINVFQIYSWLDSIGISRSILQIIEAQVLIWLVGIWAILLIFYLFEKYTWFTNWSIRAVISHIVILCFFGFLVPIGPSIVFIIWNELPFTLNNLIDVYINGTADLLKDVVLYYFLIIALSYSIYFYNEKRRNEVGTARLREDLTQAKLDLLQSQLQPHFLFNAIHNISSLMEENVKDAQNVLIKLSDLLRKSLEYQDTKFITLKEEFGILDLYLSIQIIRFSDSLDVRKNIEDDVLSEPVPPFILQPLVENTFKHGMENDLTLEINAKKEGSFIEVNIRDNGVGFEVLEEGRGIKNVRTRLTALYGRTDYEFNVKSNKEGVINFLRIPITF